MILFKSCLIRGCINSTIFHLLSSPSSQADKFWYHMSHDMTEIRIKSSWIMTKIRIRMTKIRIRMKKIAMAKKLFSQLEIKGWGLGMKRMGRTKIDGNRIKKNRLWKRHGGFNSHAHRIGRRWSRWSKIRRKGSKEKNCFVEIKKKLLV